MTGARSPEDLELLLEDAFVVKQRGALLDLFEEAAVLLGATDRQPTRGRNAVADQISLLWQQQIYLAEPRRVLLARDTALVLSKGSLSVMRRSADRTWRYAILLLSHPHEQEDRHA